MCSVPLVQTFFPSHLLFGESFTFWSAEVQTNGGDLVLAIKRLREQMLRSPWPMVLFRPPQANFQIRDRL